MDATPGPVPVALTDVTAAHPLPRPSRTLTASAWARGLLVGLVFALGLLQGSRAALGDIPLDAEPLPAAESPAGHVEQDALRGDFFRPVGSTAVRPALRLHASTWTPAEPTRLALSCTTGC